MRPLTVIAGCTVFGSLWVLTVLETREIRSARAEMSAISAESTKAQADTSAKTDKIAAIRNSVKVLQDEIAGLSDAKEAAPAWKSVPLGEAGWDADYPFVDLPKSALKGIRVGGLSFTGPAGSPYDRLFGLLGEARLSDAKVTPEAAAFLDLNDAQREALAMAYVDMNSRYQELEKKHFARSERQVPSAEQQPGEKKSFLISAFPDEMESLKQLWIADLDQMVGPSRADLFAVYTANAPFSAPLSISSLTNGTTVFSGKQVRPFDDWLRGGTNDTLITVVFTRAQTNGVRETRAGTSYYYTHGVASGSGVANLWPNLLPPEVLAGPRQ